MIRRYIWRQTLGILNPVLQSWVSVSFFSVHVGMNGVELKLNPDKTEFIIIGDKHTRESPMPKLPIIFLKSSITSPEEVKILGVTFNSGNTFDNHIGKICHACYSHLRNLQHICKFLAVDTTVFVVNAVVDRLLLFPTIFG